MRTDADTLGGIELYFHEDCMCDKVAGMVVLPTEIREARTEDVNCGQVAPLYYRDRLDRYIHYLQTTS